MKNAAMVLAVIVFFAGCGESKKMDGAKTLNPAQHSDMKITADQAAANPMIAKGLLSLKQGDVKAAIKNFDDAIKENPKDVQGYLILGQTYMHLKDFNRAIDTFMVATRVDPTNGQAHYLLATNLGLVGNYSLARLQAEKSIEIFRQNKDAENFKRSIALLQGLPENNSTTK